MKNYFHIYPKLLFLEINWRKNLIIIIIISFLHYTLLLRYRESYCKIT